MRTWQHFFPKYGSSLKIYISNSWNSTDMIIITSWRNVMQSSSPPRLRITNIGKKAQCVCHTSSLLCTWQGKDQHQSNQSFFHKSWILIHRCACMGSVEVTPQRTRYLYTAHTCKTNIWKYDFHYCLQCSSFSSTWPDVSVAHHHHYFILYRSF